MATLTAWKFNTPQGADEALAKLEKLNKEFVINVHDAAGGTWEPGNKKAKANEMNEPTAPGPVGGPFWGMLFGLIFFVPFLGAAIGAAIGAATGSMRDVGI